MNRYLHHTWLVCLAALLAACDKQDTKNIGDAAARAKVLAEETVDAGLRAMEERVGLSRIAIRNWDKEKSRRKEALIQVKAKQKELERKAGEEEAAALADAGKAQLHQARADMLRTEAARAAEISRRAETAYKQFCSTLEQRKEELQLAEMKLEVLKAELDALGKGDASGHAARARQIEEEIKQACDKLEARIELEE